MDDQHRYDPPPPPRDDNPYSAPDDAAAPGDGHHPSQCPPQPPPAPPLQHQYYGGDGLPPNRGGTILTLGIVGVSVSLLSCVCCGPLAILGVVPSIIAVVLGSQDRAAIARGARSPINEGMVTTGFVLGIVGIGVALLALILFFLWMVFNIGVGGMQQFNQQGGF